MARHLIHEISGFLSGSLSFWLYMAGYDVKFQAFEFPFFNELSEPLLEQLLPDSQVYTPNDENGFFTMTYSGSGDVNGVIEAVNIMIPPGELPNTSTSGCEAMDFEDFTPGNIAIIQRGSCSFYDKAMNAQNAGASAVIIFNEGQEGRTNAINGTLGQAEFDIPVVFVTYEIGAALTGDSSTEVHVVTETLSEIKESYNVIAETRGGDDKNTVIIGAHLDSVMASPGINDDGSGSAAILETAIQMARHKIPNKNKIKFAFWGAEELGLIGSSHYVENLSDTELADIRCYLNFDMIGSSNYVRFVFDGDGSDTEIPGPPGSELLEDMFVNYFLLQELETGSCALDGRSDYAPFMAAGVPVSGLFTGAGGIKTEEEALIYGGTAGEPYDPYYHTPDDTLENINFEVEEQMLKAIAYSVELTANIPLPKRDVTTLRAPAPDFEYLGPYLRK